MRLVVGLGNPGARYEHTRHNIAWLVLALLAERHRAVGGDESPRLRTRTCTLDGAPVTLLEPLTFMNASGEALVEWRRRHDIADDEVLVVSDDVYLPLGSLRLRASGSSGGHRGLESIEQAMGHRDYSRLRIGVGAATSSAALKSHVLEEFSPGETPALEQAIRQAADAVECWVSQGTLAAMNQFNRRVRVEESES